MASFDEFKKKVISCPDLVEIMNYFFDLTDENKVIGQDKALTAEELNNNPEILLVQKMVEKTLGDSLRKNISLTFPITATIASKYFYHGVAKSPDISSPINFLYFSDIKIGLFCFIKPDGTTLTFRFSLSPEIIKNTANIH